jgi:hypothetical protein
MVIQFADAFGAARRARVRGNGRAQANVGGAEVAIGGAGRARACEFDGRAYGCVGGR